MRKFCCMVVVLGVVAVMTAPASAQDTSAIIFAANVWISSEGNAKFAEAGSMSQCWDAKHGVSYGEIDWSQRGNYAVDWCTAGYQWRLANQHPTTPDHYERLAHWGYGYGRDFYRFNRGVVRYDEDTFVVLGTAMGRTNNLNGAMVPIMSQLEYRADWYGVDPMDTDNQWSWVAFDQFNQLQLAQSPMAYESTTYQWGPGPPTVGATLVDWCFTGGGLTGKLQLAESTIVTKMWNWGNDPNKPSLPYYSFDVDTNMKQVDNEWGVRQGDWAWQVGDTDGVVANGGPGVPPYTLTDANATFLTDVAVGNRCQVFSGTGVVNVGVYNVGSVDSDTQLTLAGDAGSATGVVYRVTEWGAPSARGDVYVGPGGSGSAGSSATILDLEVFYGASENVIYTCQFQGRIYKMTGVKNLGYRRMENQPQAPSRVTNVSGSAPVYTILGGSPGPVYGPGVHDNGKPLLGDKPSDYPSTPTSGSGPNPQGPYGVGITATEMFADKTGDRRYVGLAVDAGGRVYAVSQRVMENGAELAAIGGGATLVNVWNIDPAVPSGFSLTDPNASFVAPDSLNDVILISGGTNVNVGQYTVVSVYDAHKVELSGDPGYGGLADAVYIMYEAGQNPKPSTTKTQGSSFKVDRTVLLASDIDGVLANGGGGGPFALTDANADFLADGVSVDDNMAVIASSPFPVGNVGGSYNITAVTATVLTLADDAGAGNPIFYEVYRDSQDVFEGDSDAGVATTVLTDANATFVTNANIDPLGGDKLAIISGSTVNVGVYTIANGGVTETTLTITAGDMGNSGVAGDVVYEVVDGKAGFALTDLTADFVAANVAYGDTVKLGWDGDPNLPDWGSGDYTVRGVSTQQLDISRDAGDSYALLIQDTYDVFAPGSANWQSEALLDIFQADGTLDTTVDLNTLLRHDGTTMGASITSGGLVSGFMVGGDVEIAPNLVYEVTPADDVTRLWICGVTDPDAGDGLDLLVVDVTVDGDGLVSDVSYLGAIDTGNLTGGEWYTGDFNVDGFVPFNMWVAFNDLEFDAAGNAVVVGGRAGNDNRYMAMAAADVLLAVGNMIQEAGLSGDAVVGAGARYLDMNYFGLGNDFGLAFDNSAEGPAGDELPLRNYGSLITPPVPPIIAEVSPDPDSAEPGVQYTEQLVLLQGTPTITWSLVQGPGTAQVGQNGLVSNWTPTVGDIGVTFDFEVQALNTAGSDTEAWQVTVIDNRPLLVSHDPDEAVAGKKTWSKVKNNCVWLTFDVAPVLTGGNELLVRTIGTTMGPDLGGSFTCTIDTLVDPTGKTLKAKETLGPILANKTWYRVEPNLLVAQPFAVDICTLIGDANGDTRVLAGDYSSVRGHIGDRAPASDQRYDINGDGRVLAGDYSSVRGKIGDRRPTKPAG